MKKRMLLTALVVVSVSALFACGGGGGGGTTNPKGVINLPKTGQTTKYATGDDGDLQKGVAWPSPRFTDNSDGTVTDNLTGLMWLKDANCINTQYASFDNDGTAGDGMVTWQHALDFVAGINAGTYPNCGGGHTGWRLPNVNELGSLVNYGQTDSATWLNGQGFSNVQADDPYWSSTTYAGETSWALWVLMYYGAGSTEKAITYLYVWPVRDAAITAAISLPKTGQTTSYATGDDGDLQKGVSWPRPRFTDNSDGTVTDNLTGLTWLMGANCINTHYASFDNDGTAGDGKVTWQHALDFVTGINAGTYSNCGGGYTDWRLPNVNELHSLVDVSKLSPALPANYPFTNVKSDAYWSSTTYSNEAWDIYMYSGSVGWNNMGQNYYVWPVRGGQ